MSLSQMLMLPPGYGFDAAVNTIPVITVPGAQTAYSDTAKAIAGTSIADAESQSQTVVITLTNGTFSLASTTGLSFSVGDGTADAAMTFSGTLANVNIALATLTYTSTSNFVGTSTFTINATDSSGGVAAQKTIAITVTHSLLSGLTAYYDCAEASGSLLDSLGVTNGTAFNTPGSGAGIIGNGRTLVSASSQYFTTPVALSHNGTWTIDFWMKATSLASFRVFMDSNNGTTSVIQVYTSGGNTISVQSGSNVKAFAGLSINTGYHFNIQNNGGTITASRDDGADSGSFATTAASGATTIYIGIRADLALAAGGTVDEIGFWNRILTAGEKTYRYNSGALKAYPFS